MRRNFFLFGLAAAFALTLPLYAANPPSITQQPASQATTIGQPVTFSVNATGTLPLRFQWRRGLTGILNETNTSYTLASAQAVDNGVHFSVVISNTAGNTISTDAVLTVLADGISPTVVKVGNTPNFMQLRVKFSERVSGSDANNAANFALQDPVITVAGALLAPDGTNVTLTLSSALTEGNNYTLDVQNIFDLATNVLAPNPTHFVFQAAVAPSILTQPQSHAVMPNDSIVLTTIGTGTAPLGYRWYKGVNFVAAGSDLPLNNIQPTALGGYFCVLSNSAGMATSAVASVTFLDSYTLNLPAGFSFVANQLSNPGQGFPAPPDGTQAWKWNTAGQTFEAYVFDAQGVGSWSPQDLVVTPGEGVVLNLPIATPLTFFGERVTPLLPVSLAPGFNLLAAQTPRPADYPDIVGTPQEGSTVYRFRAGTNSVAFTENNYRISYFRNGVWHDAPPKVNIGESVFVNQMSPVVITSQPVAQTNVPPGQSVSFNVSATGTPPIHYQWLLNGTPIPGGTNPDYFISAANPTNAGIYSVAVGNVVGDITSQRAPLRLNLPLFNLTDAFAAQLTFNDFDRTNYSHNRNATLEPGEPMHAGKHVNASVWFTWMVPANGIMTISAAGSGFDTILAAYTGLNVSNLTLVDASDDDAGYACSRIRFNAKANTPYRICVAGLGDEMGDVLLGWHLEVTSQTLPEIVVQPEDLTVGYGDTAQFFVTATNGALTYQWFRDGGTVPGGNGSILTISNVSDTSVGNYFVRISNGNRSRDSLTVSLQIEVPPPGVPLSGARASAKFFDLSLPDGSGGGVPLKGAPPKLGGTVNHGYSGSQILSSVGVGKDPGEPNHCGVTGGNSVWYTVQATNNGTMYVNTDGSSFNTVLAVYVGPGYSYATLTNVACDNNSGLDGLDSRTSFAAKSNTIYYCAVDGVGGASGTVKIAFNLVRPLAVTNLVYSSAGGGQHIMKINGTPGLATTVQTSTNATFTNWTSLVTNTPASGTFTVTNSGVGFVTNRYYRAVNNF